MLSLQKIGKQLMPLHILMSFCRQKLLLGIASTQDYGDIHWYFEFYLFGISLTSPRWSACSKLEQVFFQFQMEAFHDPCVHLVFCLQLLLFDGSTRILLLVGNAYALDEHLQSRLQGDLVGKNVWVSPGIIIMIMIIIIVTTSVQKLLQTAPCNLGPGLALFRRSNGAQTR